MFLLPLTTRGVRSVVVPPQDIGEVFRSEVANLVIVHYVPVQVFPVGSDVHHAGMRIPGVVRNVVFGDEDYMVVVITGVSEHPVHVQGIGLVAVVGPAGRSGHHHGKTVFQRFVFYALVFLVEGHDNIRCPIPHLVHAALAGMVAAGHVFHQVVFSVVVTPVAIPASQLANMRFLVEYPAAGSAGHAGDAAAPDALEALAQAVGRPGELAGIAVASVHYGHYGLPECLQPGRFHVRQGKPQQGEAVIELGIAALDFPAGKGPPGGGEAALGVSAEGYTPVVVCQFAFQRGVTREVRAEDIREKARIDGLLSVFVAQGNAILVDNLVQHQHVLRGGGDEENQGGELGPGA